MKIFFGTIILACVILLGCGNNKSNIDICRCLTEPGDSEWTIDNNDACNDAISKELGVDNWEEINMNKNPDINARFDSLANRCQ